MQPRDAIIHFQQASEKGGGANNPAINTCRIHKIEMTFSVSYILLQSEYMKRLWAPWRTKFVETKISGCVFCDVQKDDDGPANLIIFRGKDCFAILNRYPYTTGHLMIVANAHLNSFEDLDLKTRAEMMEMSTHAVVVIRRVYHPDGFNVGANIGAAAGAGITGHVHIHVVPRWTGDSNFMLTLAETKVMPEALEATYARLRAAWEER
jgi:ATP adenylyltransferase